MRRYSFLIPALAAAILSVSCNKTEIADIEEPAATLEELLDDNPAIIPGQIVVQLSEELTQQIEQDIRNGAFLQTKSGAMNSVFAALGATEVTPLFDNGGEWEPRHREFGLHRWFRVTYSEEMPVTKALGSIDDIPGIVSVEPVRKVKSTETFNDPGLRKQWHYSNDGSLGNAFAPGCDINVTPVWENYTGGKNNVIVAIQDGGIDLKHEDLAAVVIPGGKDGSKNFVSNSYSIVAHDHGTHVAGTVGAINNNGIGVSGIAGGLDGKGGVKLLSCQVFQEVDGEDKSGDQANAMVWGADHGAVISQNSWGYVYKTKEDAAKGSVGYMGTAIDYFIKYAGCDNAGNQLPGSPMKGGVVIFAAGNDNWPNGWPAQYSEKKKGMISVASVGPNFIRASYSNYGDWVSICAPGGDVQYGNPVYSTLPNNEYGYMQGTSMACPHVSGVAALVVSYFGGPGFTNDMLVDKLLGSANTKVVSPNQKIGGLVDAYGAMTYGGTIAPDPVKDYSVKASSNNISFSWKVTADQDDKKAYGYTLYASKDKSAIEKLDPRSVPSTVKYVSVEVGDIAVGADITGTISGLEFTSDYYTTIVGYDYRKNISAKAPVKSVRTTGNNPPVVKTDYSGSFNVKAHEVLQVVYSIYDPDGHSIKVDFNGGSKAASSELLPDGTYRLSVVGKNDEPGDYTAVYTVTDAYGARTEYKVAYTILENHAPEIRKNMESMFFEDISMRKAINMEDYIYDPDGEQLTYTVSMSSRGIVHLNQVENSLNLTTLLFGRVTINVTASDARGLQKTLTFDVLVRDPASEADVYPNPVKDYLNVSDGMDKNIKVTVTNSAGQVVFTETGSYGAFNPMRINMTDCAPGRYGVRVDASGKITSKTVVKL